MSELQQILKEAFEAGGRYQMKPFTTDLCGVDCPNFEEWFMVYEVRLKGISSAPIVCPDCNTKNLHEYVVGKYCCAFCGNNSKPKTN